MLRLTVVESAIMEKIRKSRTYALEANKAFRKSQSSTLRLVYPDIGNPEYLMVIHTSKSKKLERVTKRPMASETMAVAESVDAGHFIALMTKEIFGLKTAPRVFTRTYNKSQEDYLKSSNVTQDLRLRADTARPREINH